MKTLNKIIGSCVVALPILASCTGNFDDMNTNPYVVTDGEPGYLLNHVTELCTNVSCDPYQRAENLYGHFYAHYLSNTVQGWVTDRYGYNDGWIYTALWTPYYTALKETKYVANEISDASHAQYSNVAQMMRIITAWRTITVTDAYGDIPYSKAGLGDDQVAFDTQEQVYDGIFKELTEAVDALKNPPSGVEQSSLSADQDLIFAGDVQKWIRFANSVRLRAAMRLTNINPEKAKSEAEAALAAGVMESEDDNAMVRITATGGNAWGQPLYMISQWDCFVMSSDMEKILKHESTVFDPRMPLWFGVTINYRKAHPEAIGTTYTDEMFSGSPNGMSDSQIGQEENGVHANSQAWGLKAYPDWNTGKATVSDGPGNSVLTMPLKAMAYSEVCFLKAEAAIRGWSGAGDAKTNYENGIRASFAEARSNIDGSGNNVDPSLYTTANDETYITTGNVAWNASDSQEAKLKKIITQKWIALYPDGFEAWSEFRRTGYPELTPIQQSDDASISPAKGQFVKKIRYPDAERRDNPNSTASTLNNNQGDGMNVRVWWDTKSK